MTFLEHLTESELSSLDPEKTIFIFSISPLESYGPYLPLNLGVELALKKAKKIEDSLSDYRCIHIKAPFLGTQTFQGKFALIQKKPLLKQWLLDTTLCLTKSQFKFFLVTTGHPTPQTLTAFEEVSKTIKRRKIGFRRSKALLLSVDSYNISFIESLKSPLIGSPKEHGGALDGSLALSLKKIHENSPFQSLPSQQLPKSDVESVFRKFIKKDLTYWGSPENTNAKQIDDFLTQWATDRIDAIKVVLKTGHPKSHFRSWYSLYLPNQSYFLAWILALTILLLLFFWMKWVSHS